ncbi:MAG TPA: SOS response-associated peptidase [Marmoricola sp.]|jgi:putative SOS response-associated peptidase YedK|nr:SOS response-associated peptidase [Marmoricola sp.]
MCGRYASSLDPEDIVEEFEIRTALPADLPRLEPDYNVAPTKEVYAVLERPPRSVDGEELPAERQVRVLNWGLVPSWAKDPKIGSRMINARMETVAEKPAYRRAFEKRRAILPADGYYEWYSQAPLVEPGRDAKAAKPKKQPFYIRPQDGSILAMAGLYELWRDPTKTDDDPLRWKWTCTVITTDATDDLGRIHDRMPLMVAPDAYDAWLDLSPRGPDELLSLLQPAVPGLLEAYPVRSLVSNVANNGPELIEPLPLEALPLEQ